MSYTKTNWVNGETPVNADNMNKIEDQLEKALVIPTAVLASNELVGVGVNGEQVRVQIGDGLTLSGSTSPYMLSASGSSGGTQLYQHFVRFASTLVSQQKNLTVISTASSAAQYLDDLCGIFSNMLLAAYTPSPEPSPEGNALQNFNVNIVASGMPYRNYQAYIIYFDDVSNLTPKSLQITNFVSDTVTPL